MEERVDFRSVESPALGVQVKLIYLEHCSFRGETPPRRTRHTHPFWQAELMISNEAIAHIENLTVTVDNGTVLLVPPGLHHWFEYRPGNTEYFSFKFSCVGEPDLNGPSIYRTEPGVTLLRDYFRAILADNHAPRRMVAVHAQNAIKTLIELDGTYGHELARKSVADRVREIILASPGRCPVASEIAEQIGLSRPHLSQLIKQESGMSLKPFIDRERAKCAVKLVRLPDLSITEAAYQLGFSDVFAFSKFFKRVTGVSPSSYQRRAVQLTSHGSS